MSIGYVVVVQRLHSDVYGLRAGPNLRLPVIPSPPSRGMERCACNTRGQSQWRPRRDPGVRLLRVLRPSCSRRHLTVGHGAEASVAQPIVDEGEQLAGRSDLGDASATRAWAASRWKLAVYTAAAGIHPHRVIPVVLDTGTDNLALLNDEMHLGARHARIRDHRYDELIDAYVTATTKLFPQALLR